MKLYSKRFAVFKDWITLIPSIDIHINVLEYRYKNFVIALSWLCFHARFVWVESEEA